MGHGLHNMLSEVKEEYFSGLSNVEHDAIELPSQFMENFAWDYEVLKELSEHIDDKSILPLDLFEKMQKGKFFLSANQMIRQYIFAYLDMYIHTYDVNADDAEKEIFNKWKTRDLDDRSKFLPTFSHIFSGGYSAGYYSYKWSEVLSSDAFAALKEAGKTYIDQKEIANKFKETILSRGGTKDMLDNFIEFRGRTPNVKYLLEDNGIIVKEKIKKNHLY
jgi:oligopeptidase A